MTSEELAALRVLYEQGEMFGLDMLAAAPDLSSNTLYVVLKRLADKGLVQSRSVEDTDLMQGEPARLSRRLFSLTEAGRVEVQK